MESLTRFRKLDELVTEFAKLNVETDDEKYDTKVQKRKSEWLEELEKVKIDSLKALEAIAADEGRWKRLIDKVDDIVLETWLTKWKNEKVMLPKQKQVNHRFDDINAEEVKFWDAMKADRTNVSAHAIIKLPENIYFFGDRLFGQSLYIRPCYLLLLEKVFEIFEDPETPHLVILGNPGIGKTYFGYFILHHLSRLIHKDSFSIVYENGKNKRRYLFSSDFIVSGTQDHFYDYLIKSTTYYIVDGCKPTFYPAKTILLTSPRHEIWHEFNKMKCTYRYMPVWEEDEIMKCRSAMYSHLPVDLIKTHFYRWGGIARYVLEYALNDVQQNLLESALDSADLKSLVRAFGKCDHSDGSHRLIHMSVKPDFTQNSYRFASEYVKEQIYSRLYASEREKLIQFIAVSNDIGQFGALRGVLFEQHAHHIISQGGDFQIRPLHLANDNKRRHTSSTTINVISSPILVFNNDNEVKNKTDRYFRPRSNNYESVDSFIKPNILFQMTGARKHPLKQVGLHNVLNLLGNPTNPWLFFVLPPDRFNDFKYQPYQDTNSKPIQSATYKNVRQIEQYALKIDLISGK